MSTTTLYPSYDVDRPDGPDADDRYVWREFLRLAERKDIVRRLRSEAAAKHVHADELDAETAALVDAGYFDSDGKPDEAKAEASWKVNESIPEPSQEARVKAAEHYFGGCPRCGDTDGYLNQGRDHWFVCDKHRVRWFVGSNLFSSWRHESSAQHAENLLKLMGYRVVDPLHEWKEPDRLKAQAVELEEDWRKIIQDPQGSPSDDFADDLPF